MLRPFPGYWWWMWQTLLTQLAESPFEEKNSARKQFLICEFEVAVVFVAGVFVVFIFVVIVIVESDIADTIGRVTF